MDPLRDPVRATVQRSNRIERSRPYTVSRSGPSIPRHLPNFSKDLAGKLPTNPPTKDRIFKGSCLTRNVQNFGRDPTQSSCPDLLLKSVQDFFVQEQVGFR